MQLRQLTRDSDSITLETPAGKIRLQVWAEKIVHVQFTRQEHFSETPSLMVLPKAAQSEPETPWSVEESDQALILRTRSLRLAVRKDTCAFTWMDGAGNLLVSEPPGGGKALHETEIEGRRLFSTRLDLVFSPGEAIYGLGQHEEGVLNYRGRQEFVYQHNLKVAMPVLVSTRGYAFLFDSYSQGNFHDDQYGTYYWCEAEDEMDFYFLYGPEFDVLVAGVRALTGRPTLFPKWAYGYVQSKERYKTQDELVAVVREFRERAIPLDCIVLDWLSWPGKLWGQKSFDPERFPQPGKMMDDLHRLNAHLLVSVWPKMRNDGPDQVALREAGCLLGDGETYDAFDERARALFWEQANQGIFQFGVDGWWCDSTEPFEPDWLGPVKPEPWQRAHINTGVFKKYLDPERINAYSLLHAKGMYEGQRSVTGAKRVVNLTRSAYPGQHRYGTITWSGDITARWETLRKQIPAGLNFAITGSPRWTLDVGAFFVAARETMWCWQGAFPQGVADLGYREFFLRMFQLGAFLPMFRVHGTDTPREVWQFGEPGEVWYDTLVKFIRLRYRLLPYIYSLAGWETHRDYTSLRALAFDFRSDPRVYDVADQFMFGPALMVCPVTFPVMYGSGSTPLDDGPRQRPVYLPAGTDWYDFWTGRRFAGGQVIQADAPLETLPLYVRAGSILPLGPAIQHTGAQPGAPLELRVYPGADVRFLLYEDEGDGYAYEQGAFAWIPVEWNDMAKLLTVGPRAGSYQGIPAEQIFHVALVSEGSGVGVEPAQARATLTTAGGQAVQWRAERG
jgi:alpha-D-xyloside xylohydrolase